MNAIDKFIENWEEKAVNYFSDLLDEYTAILVPRMDSEKHKEWISKHTKVEHNLMERGFYEVRHRNNEDFFKDIVAKEGEAKKISLIARVEKKAGLIVDASLLEIGVDGSINGIIKGEEKSVHVQTIYAGGYNIQQLHYRILIK